LGATTTEVKEVRMQRRIKRNYRHFNSPSRALSFCQRVDHALTSNPKFPDSSWGSRIVLRQQFHDAVGRLDLAYNVAFNGDRLLIMDRDKLWQEIVLMLDEIVSLLEAAAVRDPDALCSTGFDVAQERRSASRTPLALTELFDFRVLNSDVKRKAIGIASGIRGAIIYEVHATDKDPSVEANWLHKLNAHDPSHMEMENIDPGNIYFRARAFGPDGPGPWSPVVSATIT
jgi:hypothetical protein